MIFVICWINYKITQMFLQLICPSSRIYQWHIQRNNVQYFNTLRDTWLPVKGCDFIERFTRSKNKSLYIKVIVFCENKNSERSTRHIWVKEFQNYREFRFKLPSLYHVEKSASIHWLGDIAPFLTTMMKSATLRTSRKCAIMCHKIHGGIWLSWDNGVYFVPKAFCSDYPDPATKFSLLSSFTSEKVRKSSVGVTRTPRNPWLSVSPYYQPPLSSPLSELSFPWSLLSLGK
jgi:hypothetical protein